MNQQVTLGTGFHAVDARAQEVRGGLDGLHEASAAEEIDRVRTDQNDSRVRVLRYII